MYKEKLARSNHETDLDFASGLFGHILMIDDVTSLPYFRVKLSCVCLMFAFRKKVMTYSDPMVTYSHPKMTYSYPKVT